MQPLEKQYHEEVIIPKVWELITDPDNEPRTHLVSKEVSEYIRTLEADILNLRTLLAENIKKQKEEAGQEMAKIICETFNCDLDQAEKVLAENLDEKKTMIVAVKYMRLKIKQIQEKPAQLK